jgi:hypothetical protein
MGALALPPSAQRARRVARKSGAQSGAQGGAQESKPSLPSSGERRVRPGEQAQVPCGRALRARWTSRQRAQCAVESGAHGKGKRPLGARRSAAAGPRAAERLSAGCDCTTARGAQGLSRAAGVARGGAAWGGGGRGAWRMLGKRTAEDSGLKSEGAAKRRAAPADGAGAAQELVGQVARAHAAAEVRAALGSGGQGAPLTWLLRAVEALDDGLARAVLHYGVAGLGAPGFATPAAATANATALLQGDAAVSKVLQCAVSALAKAEAGWREAGGTGPRPGAAMAEALMEDARFGELVSLERVKSCLSSADSERMLALLLCKPHWPDFEQCFPEVLGDMIAKNRLDLVSATVAAIERQESLEERGATGATPRSLPKLAGQAFELLCAHAKKRWLSSKNFLATLLRLRSMSDEATLRGVALLATRAEPCGDAVLATALGHATLARALKAQPDSAAVAQLRSIDHHLVLARLATTS